MRFVRAFLRWLTSLFLHISLLLFIVSLCFYFFFGNKQLTKDVLVESGAYNKFIPAIIEDNRKAAEAQSSALPFTDSNIAKAANESFQPVVLKEKTDQFIDALYRWLSGEEKELNFTVNLSKQKDDFIERVSTYAAVRLSKLPNCQTADLGQKAVFELDCRPENVPLSFVKNKVAEDLQRSDIFKNVVITQNDLPKTETGEYLHQQLGFLPTINQLFRRSVWFFAALLVLSAILFVATRRSKRAGFKALGRDLFSNATTFIVMTLIFGFVLPKYTDSLSVQGGETVKVFNSITDIYVRRFDLLIINITLQIIAVAIVILALERMSRPTSVYAGLRRRAGISSSQTVSRPIAGNKRNALPPVQTSEVKKAAKTRKRKTTQYRKMGL